MCVETGVKQFHKNVSGYIYDVISCSVTDELNVFVIYLLQIENYDSGLVSKFPVLIN
jgi:hypothetical protein